MRTAFTAGILLTTIAGIMYLAFAFVVMDMNPTRWDKDARFLYVFAVFLFSAIVIPRIIVSQEKEEKEG